MGDKKIDSYENIILFGAGEGWIARWLLHKYKEKIRLIVDNNSKKWGRYSHGIKVASVDELDNFNKENSVVIVSIYNHLEEVKKQLCMLGWEENIILAREEMEELYSVEFYLFTQNMSIENYAPQICNIELCSICNCKCVYCPFHGVQNIKEGQKGLMSWETLKKVVEQLKEIKTLKQLSTVGAGEIFLHPEWFEMVQYILEETKIKSLIMYTNGMLLNKENIEKMRILNVEEIKLEISIDGKTKEENDRYRIGSKYEVIKRNIDYLVNSKANINILITNCYPIKEEELNKITEHYESLYLEVPKYLKADFPGIEATSQSTYIFNKGKAGSCVESLKMKEVEFSENRHKCLNLFNRIAVNYRGDLLRCSCGYPGVEGIGNVRNSNLYDLWKKDTKMNQARSHFIEGNIEYDICSGCPQRGMGKYYIMVE